MIQVPAIAAVTATALWAWVVPFAGPILARAAPFVWWLPSFSSLKLGLRVGLYVAALGVGAWGGVKALRWWQGDVISQIQADKLGRAKCEAVLSAANIEARSAALDQRERALKLRESEIETDAAEMSRFGEELEAARANSKGDNAGVLSADDGWLRAWQSRR